MRKQCQWKSLIKIKKTYNYFQLAKMAMEKEQMLKNIEFKKEAAKEILLIKHHKKQVV